MSLLGIDLGTSGVKAGVFNLDGACVAQAYREYDMLHPQPGWSELDTGEVWEKTRAVIAEVFGIPIVRPRVTEAGVLGAAMLAGISTGVLGSAEKAVEVFVKTERTFEPDPARHALYREKHALYQQLYPALKPVLGSL